MKPDVDDGHMNSDEFLSILKDRSSRGLDKARDVGVVRGLARIWECIKSE